MDPEFKAKWVEALRSGKYVQGTGNLNADGQMCCLAVACEVSGKGKWKASGNDGRRFYYQYEDYKGVTRLPGNLILELGLTYEEETSLMQMNDERGCSFPDIADYIEENL